MTVPIEIHLLLVLVRVAAANSREDSTLFHALDSILELQKTTITTTAMRPSWPVLVSQSLADFAR